MSPVVEDVTQSGEAFIDAVERVADHSVHLLSEELTLARLEMVEKLPLLAGGLVRAIVGFTAALTGMLVASFALAFLLADYVFSDHPWIGFALIAVVLFVAAAVFLRGAWSTSRGAMPPLPTQAIDQAGKIRGAFRR